MGQFAAVIVPQYCGAPAEKPGVLEWAIALKALEMAEQSHPFPAHPIMDWMGPCCQLWGVSHQLPVLHFGSWVQVEGHPLGDSCLSPKLPGSLSVKNSLRKGGNSRSCAHRSSQLCPTWSLSWLLLPRAARGCFEHFSVLIWTRD